MRKRNRPGFAFTVVDGPYRTSEWSVYPGDTRRGNSDFYLSCRDLGGAYKVSFHESGDWRVAFTSEFWEGHEGDGKPGSRVLDRWTRPVDHYPGLSVAYRVVFPNGSTNIPIAASGDGRLMAALPPANPGLAVNVGIFVAKPQALADATVQEFLSHAIGSFDLPNGDRVAARYLFVPYTPPMPRNLDGGWFVDTARTLAPPGLVRSMVFRHDEGGHYAIDAVPDQRMADQMLELIAN